MGVRGGDGGIRTLDRALQPYNGLANRRLQPLGHVSGEADMPHTALSRKRQIVGQCDLSGAHQLPTRVAGWIGLPFPTPIEVSCLHRGNPS